MAPGPRTAQRGDQHLTAGQPGAGVHHQVTDGPAEVVEVEVGDAAEVSVDRRDRDPLEPASRKTDYSGYPDCRDDTIKAMQLALNLGMQRRFVLETPLMWRDKAATWALAAALGDEALVELVRISTHSCYLGDRSRLHDWGYGCGSCPACELRAAGWQRWRDGAGSAFIAAPPSPGDHA